MQKRGKMALITGASSGIGREFAHIHAANGGDLVIIARNEKKLTALKQELKNKYQTKAKVIVRDLTEADAPAAIYKICKDSGLRIDYLINNAGFGGMGAFYQRDMQKDISMIKLNIIALTKLTRLFITDFISRNQGKILNVSSTASFVPGPFQAVYYATKAYVTFFSNAVSEELRETNVTVTNLMPGATKTNFGKISGMDKTAMFENPANARRDRKSTRLNSSHYS